MGRNGGEIFTQVISFDIFLKEFCIWGPESDTLILPCLCQCDNTFKNVEIVNTQVMPSGERLITNMVK